MTVFLARNDGLHVPPPRIHLGQMGFSQDLGVRAHSRVQAVIIHNLTVNEPITSYRYTATSFSHRMRVLGSHIMQNKKEYAKTIAWTVAFVAPYALEQYWLPNSSLLILLH